MSDEPKRQWWNREREEAVTARARVMLREAAMVPPAFGKKWTGADLVDQVKLASESGILVHSSHPLSIVDGMVIKVMVTGGA